MQDFTTLLPIYTEHVVQIPDEEKEVNFRYFKKWIAETLELIGTVDIDKYSGGMLVAGSAAFALAYSVGSASGTVVFGTAMQVISSHAGPITIGAIVLVFALFFGLTNFRT